MEQREKLATAQGLSWNTVKRAKEVTRVESEQRRVGNQSVWYWFDPSAPGAPGKLAPLPALRTLAAVAGPAEDQTRGAGRVRAR